MKVCGSLIAKEEAALVQSSSKNVFIVAKIQSSALFLSL